MATVLDGLVSSALKKLGKLVEDQVVMTLCVGREITRLKKNLEAFCAVRENAEAIVMRNESLRVWWKRLSDVMFNVEDVLDIFMVHSRMRHECSPCCSMFSCFVKLLDDHRVGTRIKNINTEFDLIRRTSDMFNPGPGNPIRPQPMITTVDTRQTAPMIEPGVVGTAIIDDVDSMVKAIVDRCDSIVPSVLGIEGIEPTVFGIEGMGGIGKTTLAKKIYWEQRIRNDFQIHMWLCISETFTETELLKQAIGMAGGNYDQLDDKARLQQRLEETVDRKSVFLVLDDVHKPDVWHNLLQPSFTKLLNVCVLVTTRSNDVLKAMGATHTRKVNRMSEADGLRLLMRNAFQLYDGTFLELGRAIVAKCDGLPLAIKAVAGILSTKRDKEGWEDIRDTPLWHISGLPAEVADALYISYTNLPYELKQCFLWCALLPPNFEIHRDAVSCWWVAQGFVSEEPRRSIHETAENYYYELITRNLLQPKPEFEDQAVSTMHDVLRSLGQYLTEDHSLYMNAKDSLSRAMNVKDHKPKPNLRHLGIATSVEELPALQEHKFLRTLLVFFNRKFKLVPNDIFRKLQYIRVLIFSGTSIKSIPESVGNLVLLKLLDLSDTEIKELPESTGRLISLEHLCLRGCHNLHSLPASLMRLCNITFLELPDTALDNVPNGIRNFQQLYNLRGVFESDTGFRLDELQCFPKIRRLWVTKLEKATPGGDHVLEKSPSLKELGLRCTMSMSSHHRTHYEEDRVQIIQQVYDRLAPPSRLKYIFIFGFPGTTFPEWLRVEPEVIMPSLGHMHLNECISCTELPPAGQMPELEVLHIRGADAVETIGTELLGKGVGTPAVFFPKLIRLYIIGMCSLKSWSLNADNLCDNMEGNSPRLSLMPELMRLYLLDCPKLTALPPDLSKLAKLKRIHIEGAHGLKEVANLPKVVWLKVKDNRSLSTVSNLCELQDLLAQDCPALDRADNLSSLKRLYMIGCTGAQKFRNCLLREGVQFSDTQFPDETL